MAKYRKNKAHDLLFKVSLHIHVTSKFLIFCHLVFSLLIHIHYWYTTKIIKGMDSEPHKTVYVYVKYHHKFIPGTRECISGLLRKIFVFKVGKPSFFPASE